MAGRPRGTVKVRLFRYATYRGDGDFTPEQRLWAGVLEQAVADFEREKPQYTARGNGWQVKAQVAGWFKNEGDELGTFIWACDHLNIDYKVVRQRLGVSV